MFIVYQIISFWCGINNFFQRYKNGQQYFFSELVWYWFKILGRRNVHDIPIYIKIFQFLFRAHTRKKYLKKLEHSQNMLEYLKSGRGRTYLYTNINTAIGKYSLYVNHFMNSMIEVFLCIEQICLKAVICFLQFNIRLHFSSCTSCIVV